MNGDTCQVIEHGRVCRRPRVESVAVGVCGVVAFIDVCSAHAIAIAIAAAEVESLERWPITTDEAAA